MTFEQMADASMRAGFHWFDPDTKRLFGTRLCGVPVYNTKKDRIYFVSSDRTGPGHSTRKYTVRVFDVNTSECETAEPGGFLRYSDRRTALKAAKQLASK